MRLGIRGIGLKGRTLTAFIAANRANPTYARLRRQAPGHGIIRTALRGQEDGDQVGSLLSSTLHLQTTTPSREPGSGKILP